MTKLRGISFPLQIQNGGLKTSEDVDLIRDHILSVLQTRPYERVMNAGYGLKSQEFNTVDPDLVRAKVYETIMDTVDGVSSLDIIDDNSSLEDGIYRLKILYEVANVIQPPIEFELNG